MNKKIHKKITKLEKFLNIDELVKKADLKKLIKTNPLNQAKKSIKKFYQDYKKIKEREDIKREKKIYYWSRYFQLFCKILTVLMYKNNIRCIIISEIFCIGSSKMNHL